MYRCRETACHMAKRHQLSLKGHPVRAVAIRGSWVSKRVGGRLSEAAEASLRTVAGIGVWIDAGKISRSKYPWEATGKDTAMGIEKTGSLLTIPQLIRVGRVLLEICVISQ